MQDILTLARNQPLLARTRARDDRVSCIQEVSQKRTRADKGLE